jgi:LmbE family N-acetylglucosaminyl deacetylase
MATIVTFHAHPDDEAIATGGVMAKYAAEGHRVILVVATRGEHGEVAEGVLRDGEELWQRRTAETEASARILGVARVEFLGYVDSGMMGTPENDAPESFWQADVDEAAKRLAAILDEERADVLTVYDDNGNYGHPDHIQVHRVGSRAGEMSGTPKVYEATVNRDELKRLWALRADTMPTAEEAPDAPDMSFIETLGVTEDRLTTVVDVRDYVDAKRASMASHASQIAENSFFLTMPDEAFAEAFGREWFILRGVPPGLREHDLLEGLPGPA